MAKRLQVSEAQLGGRAPQLYVGRIKVIHMKLSGWARMGTVLSIIWALGVIGTSAYEYYLSPLHESSALVSWADSKPKPWQVDWKNNPPKIGDTFDPDAYLRSKGMSQQKIDALSYKPSFRWSSIALFVFVPPFVAWLVVIVLRFVISWVATGFKEKG